MPVITFSMDVIFPYSEAKLKIYLKQATQRIKLANNKRSTASSRHKREIGKLLEEGKTEKAIIRVEHVIRDDYMMEAYEIAELMCDLLYERIRQISKNEICPPDLAEAVSTVIYVSSRLDISELEEARKQFRKKYGKEFVVLCIENSRGTVNNRVVDKLNLIAPSPLLVRSYLQEISKEFCVPWDDDTFPIREDGTYRDGYQVGYSVPLAPSSGLGGVYESLPPGYNDAQFHTTTEVGYGASNNMNNYQEQDQPPHYSDALLQPNSSSCILPPPPPPAPLQYDPNQQQGQSQQQVPPQVQDNLMQIKPQQQYHDQQQQHINEESQPPSSSLQNDTTSQDAPSYDDLMARFKNLKN